MAGPPPPSTHLPLSPCRSLSSRTSCLSSCPLVWTLLLRPLCLSSSLGWSCMLDPQQGSNGEPVLVQGLGSCLVPFLVVMVIGIQFQIKNTTSAARTGSRASSFQQGRRIAHNSRGSSPPAVRITQFLPGSSGRHGNRVGNRTLLALLV